MFSQLIMRSLTFLLFHQFHFPCTKNVLEDTKTGEADLELSRGYTCAGIMQIILLAVLVEGLCDYLT